MPREGNHTYQGGERQAVAEDPTARDTAMASKAGRLESARVMLGSGSAVADGPEVGPNDFSTLAAELSRLIELEDRLFAVHHELAGHVDRLTAMAVPHFGNMPNTDEPTSLLQLLTIRVERLQIISAVTLDVARQLRHV